MPFPMNTEIYDLEICFFFFPNTYVSKIKIHCNACKVSTKGVSVAETNPVKCLIKHS